MHAAALFPRQGRFNHEAGRQQHVLQFPALDRSKLPGGDIAVPEFHLGRSLPQIVSVATNPDVTSHQARQRIANVGQVQFVILEQRPLPFGSQWQGRETVGDFRGRFGGAATTPEAVIQPFEETVRGEPVGPMQA